MTKKPLLPRRVYVKHGRYWHVGSDGKWRGLTRVSAGEPAMYRALAELRDVELSGHLMPFVVQRWHQQKQADWSPSTQRNMTRVVGQIAARFADFAPRQITAPVVFEYLQPLQPTPRTYNLHRSVLRQVLSFAALEGLRDGHNPVIDVPQRRMLQRRRIVTDAEVNAIKTALLEQKRGGAAHCAMVDLCMITGQRIGDVLRMRWQDVTPDGLLVDQAKTGQPLRIEWTPALLSAVEACSQGRDRIGYLLVQSTGSPYRYSGVRSAWVRAMARAGIEDLHIHDLRGRAGADATEAQGPYAAQKLLGHASVTMTETYTRGKTRRVAKPSK